MAEEATIEKGLPPATTKEDTHAQEAADQARASSDIDAGLDAAGVKDIAQESPKAAPVKVGEEAIVEASATAAKDAPKADTKKAGDVKVAGAEVSDKAKADAEVAKKSKDESEKIAAAAAAAPKDAEIDAITEPRGLNPENKNNWKKLQTVAKQHKAGEAKAVAELTELKKQKASIPEDVTKELEELRTLRRTFAIEKDPEFIQKYDTAVKSNFSEIEALLKLGGIPEANLKEMQAKGFGTYSMKWWNENVLSLLEESEDPKENEAGAVIKELLNKNFTASYEKQKAIKSAAEGQSEYFKTKEAQTKAQQEQGTKLVQERVKQLQEQFPWAKLQEIPKDASPEDKARITRDNEIFAETETAFKTALNPQTMEDRVDSAVKASLVFKYASELEAALKHSAALEEEMKALKQAGQTHKAGRAAPASNGAPKKATFAERANMGTDEAVEAGMRDSGL